MYVVAQRIPVEEAQERRSNDQAYAGPKFLQRDGRLDKAAGFVRLELLRPDESAIDTAYVVLTHWIDKAAFDAWSNRAPGIDDRKLAWSKSA